MPEKMLLTPMSEKKIRGNPAYQERQQQRRHHLQKKFALRRTFELGKLVEKAGLHNEDLAVVYALFLEAKEKLRDRKSSNVTI